MEADSTDGGDGTPSPEEAFKLLGNDTRIEILKTLGEADGSLSFTELRDRVGLRRGGRFNYHLDKLVGHFVTKTDADRYQLRPPGRRVVQAVLSGAVTQAPRVDRTVIDASCQLCGSPIAMRYADGRVETFCTDCSGMWDPGEDGEPGYLSTRLLPPAGIQARAPTAIYRVAWVWTMLSLLAIACDICPNCSGDLDPTVEVCDQHEDEAEICSACGQRNAVTLHSQCRTCFTEHRGTMPIYLTVQTSLFDMMTSHGLNPIDPDSIATVQRFYSTYEEEILSADPFRARITFRIEDDSLTLTVDDDLTVVDVTSSKG